MDFKLLVAHCQCIHLLIYVFLCCFIVYMCWWFLNFLLSYTKDYKNYVNGYFYIIMPLFELTKKDVIFAWNFNY
jgi:hypothetical protein